MTSLAQSPSGQCRPEGVNDPARERGVGARQGRSAVGNYMAWLTCRIHGGYGVKRGQGAWVSSQTTVSMTPSPLKLCHSTLCSSTSQSTSTFHCPPRQPLAVQSPSNLSTPPRNTLDYRSKPLLRHVPEIPAHHRRRGCRWRWVLPVQRRWRCKRCGEAV